MTSKKFRTPPSGPPHAGTDVAVIVFAFALAALLGFFTVTAELLVLLFLVLLGGMLFIYFGWRFALRAAGGDARVAVDLTLFWALVVNLPVFIAFDQTGLTRMDMFNPQSIGRIILFVMIGLTFLISRFGSKSRLPDAPSTSILLFYPVLGLVWYVLSAPASVSRLVDMVLLLFRATEWMLLMLIVVALIRDLESKYRGSFTASPLHRTFPIIVFLIVITFVVFPLFPRSIYQVGQAGIGRIGNSFAHPNVLGIIAGMGIFYAMEFRIKYYRVFSIACLALLVGSYSRAAWAGFAVAAVVFVVMRVRPGIRRIIAGISLSILLIVGYVGQDLVLSSVSAIATRGKSHEELTSASERTTVWRAARVLIAESPWVGHGYIIGPKKLNDVMASGVSASYFRANHAHNEIMQALVSGGVVAAFLTALIWLRCLLQLFRLSRFESNRSFVRCSTVWLIMLLAYGMMTPMLSMHLMIPGALLLFIYISAEYKWQEIRRSTQQKPASPNMVAKMARGAI